MFFFVYTNHADLHITTNLDGQKKHVTLHCDRTDRQILGGGRGRSDGYFCGPDNVGHCRLLSIPVPRQDECRTTV